MNTLTNDLLKRRKQAIPQGVGNIHPIFTATAQNDLITDVDGKEYIDFTSGIAVTNTGHLHPKIIDAVESQLKQFSHTCFHVSMYESYIKLAEHLNRLAPGESEKQSLFLSTGAEAVENAIKIARSATGRSGVIAFSGGFHGRTYMAVSLTGKVAPYKKGFGPFVPEIFHAPFPNPLHGISVEDALASLKNLFKSDIEANRVAAIIVEPVQGEGGFYAAPKPFMQALRKICDEERILLICDEVQTGFARTGKLFATEYADIEPDLLVLAKGLAGGFPLSAVVGKKDVMQSPNPGGLGGTYAGNPVSIAAALAVLNVIEDENLIERANKIGERIKQTLKSMQKQNPFISDVRGMGAMIAMELVNSEGEPNPELTQSIVANGREQGLLLLPCGVYGNVIRFLTPLTIKFKQLDKGLKILEKIMTSKNA
ncbi:MAG: 4-aminobutyrate--2-oxoglutarate transaminase [bacterium]